MWLHYNPRETFAGVEQFDEKREPRRARRSRPTDDGVAAKPLDDLPQRLAGKRTIGDDALGFVAIGDFPGFADAFAGRDGFAVPGEGIAAPNALDQMGSEFQRIKHCIFAVFR